MQTGLQELNYLDMVIDVKTYCCLPIGNNICKLKVVSISTAN